MSAPFERLSFPRGYTQRFGNPRCALDSLVALDANLLPLESAHPNVFPIGSKAGFAGWAIAPVMGGYALPAGVFLEIVGSDVLIPAAVGLGREDVARDQGDASLTGSGFRGIGTISGSAKLGRHAIALLVACEDRTYYRTPLAHQIELVESRRLFPALPESDRTAIVMRSLEAMHDRPQREKNRFRRGAILVARGEAVERGSQRSASRIFAIVDERDYYDGIVGVTGDRGERTGFSVRIPTDGLTAGKHELRLAAIANDGTSFSVGESASFTLRRA